jgi:hypothetical protein
VMQRNKRKFRDSSSSTQNKFEEHFIWSLAFGLIPYSNIGSSFFNSSDTSFASHRAFSSSSGGLTKAFLTNGFQFGKNWAFGLNTSFLFGQVTSTRVLTFPDSTRLAYSSDEKQYFLKGFHYDLGIQYFKSYKIHFDTGRFFIDSITKEKYKNTRAKDLSFTFGATVSPNTQLSYDLSRLALVYNYNGSAIRDTIIYESKVTGKTGIPLGFSIGASVKWQDQWQLAMDYKQENYGNQTNKLFNDSFTNSRQLSVGFIFRPDRNPENFSKSTLKGYKPNLEYRFGFRTLNTGLNVIDNTGKYQQIKEYGISFGIGIPKLKMNYSQRFNKSMFDITGEYIRRGSSMNGLASETLYRLTIGMNLNDLWFQKRKLN